MEWGVDEALTCLVVDDSRVVRKVARRMLERHGAVVREAADGQEALFACREELPRLVLLDWNMPVMDGLEFLKAARAEFGADEPVVVLCTTENDFERILMALGAGAQEYIMKPFDDAILAGKLVQLGLLPETAGS
ncbi:response regulator [Pseudoroseomonas cervicalis]|uniref:Response regulator receiver domain protein n=1 Tax=Pseudoroseomonas cervicalis ATCC 49957 TaxID=525371 RepID=D5RTC1_9PROT|nr:response regulator receiver domain protein [Pseudoroseomonas cervicalis ATCC 49957]